MIVALTLIYLIMLILTKNEDIKRLASIFMCILFLIGFLGIPPSERHRRH